MARKRKRQYGSGCLSERGRGWAIRLTGLRRREVFALRWKNVSVEQRHLTVEEAVYEGAFGTPKTSAALRHVPLSSELADVPPYGCLVGAREGCARQVRAAIMIDRKKGRDEGDVRS